MCCPGTEKEASSPHHHGTDGPHTSPLSPRRLSHGNTAGRRCSAVLLWKEAKTTGAGLFLSLTRVPPIPRPPPPTPPLHQKSDPQLPKIPISQASPPQNNHSCAADCLGSVTWNPPKPVTAEPPPATDSETTPPPQRSNHEHVILVTHTQSTPAEFRLMWFLSINL